MTEALYLIRKRGVFYRPNAEGYTINRAEAGRYTLAEAISHSHPNGPDGPRDGIDYMLANDPPASLPCKSGEGAGGLLPCPFCGGPGKLIHPMGAWVGGEEGYGPDGSRIVCATDACGMIAGKSFYGPDQDAEAATWWNARTPSEQFAKSSPDGEQGVSVAEYNDVYDKFEEVVGGSFRDGFREGWIYAQTPDGSDYDERSEEYGRAVDIEPSEAWGGHRDKYAVMLPVPALPTLKSERPGL